MTAPATEIAFLGEVVHWRGPAPFVFVAIPPEHSAEIRHAAATASYGWGCVPVAADLRGEAFTTSLFPRDGGYLLPLKKAVRARVPVDIGEMVPLRLTIGQTIG
jgi:hypothetical protein